MGTESTTDGVIHGGWIRGTDENGVPTNVYYRKVTGVTADQVFAVLGSGTYNEYSWDNDEVLTLPEVTKEMMNAVNDSNKPTLTFTAYAHQLYESKDTPFDPADAWNHVKPATP